LSSSTTILIVIVVCRVRKNACCGGLFIYDLKVTQ
jgi:hypothetical protein